MTGIWGTDGERKDEVSVLEQVQCEHSLKFDPSGDSFRQIPPPASTSRPYRALLQASLRAPRPLQPSSQMPRKSYTYRPRLIPCTFPGCGKTLSTISGLKRHLNSHPRLSSAFSQPRRVNDSPAPEYAPAHAPSSPVHSAVINTDNANEIEAEQQLASPAAPPQNLLPSDHSPASTPPFRIFTHPYLDGKLLAAVSITPNPR